MRSVALASSWPNPAPEVPIPTPSTQELREDQQPKGMAKGDHPCSLPLVSPIPPLSSLLDALAKPMLPAPRSC